MLRKWNDLCLEHVDDLALILTLENGKTLTEAKGEVTYAASFLEWFAGEAERTHGEVVCLTSYTFNLSVLECSATSCTQTHTFHPLQLFRMLSLLGKSNTDS
jgi:delta 1-pyrroline-5-carboxylate dehydrogenase